MAIGRNHVVVSRAASDRVANAAGRGAIASKRRHVIRHRARIAAIGSSRTTIGTRATGHTAPTDPQVRTPRFFPIDSIVVRIFRRPPGSEPSLSPKTFR
jgi:hypothetical protein